MLRTIEPEILDRLDAADPRALQSRRDLQTVHSLMGIPRALATALREVGPAARIVDLGSGDGTLLLRVATRLGAARMPVRAVLVDRAPAMSEGTRAALDGLGWSVEFQARDVFEWLGRANPETADVTVVSLFLHHFRDAELVELLRNVAGQSRRVVACEPRRSRTALVGASLLGLIGCNEVTQHDAKVSVRAGFRGRELSEAWPGGSDWQLAESRSGPFLHVFEATTASRPTSVPRR